MAFDIYDLIFTLLNVQPTGDFQADFLNLIFFPHVVILIWLYIIARGPVFRALHRGIGILLSLTIYIFIIYYQWYSVIANLAIFWLGATVVISLFYFMIPKLMHPGATGSRFGLGKTVAEIQQKTSGKKKLGNTIDNLRDDLNNLKREIVKQKAKLNTAQDDYARKITLATVAQLEAQEYQLNSEIRRLEREL